MAIKWARRLKITRRLFQVMHSCSAVVLSYLDADYDLNVRTNHFNRLLLACLLLLAAVKTHCSPGSQNELQNPLAKTQLGNCPCDCTIKLFQTKSESYS